MELENGWQHFRCNGYGMLGKGFVQLGIRNRYAFRTIGDKAVAMGDRGSGVMIIVISFLPQNYGFTSDRIPNDYTRW